MGGIHCPGCRQGYINSLISCCFGRRGRTQEIWSASTPRLIWDRMRITLSIFRIGGGPQSRGAVMPDPSSFKLKKVLYPN